MVIETTKAESQEKALAPFKDVIEALAPYPESHYFQLVPTVYQERSPLFRPALSVVKVNGDDPREVYPTPGGGATFCLHSQALERIGNAIGIDWKPTAYDNDPKEPYFVTAHVGGEFTDAVGERREISASATCDYREGSIGARILKGGLDVARQFIFERAESRARNRAIRKVANLPSSFNREELRKPFVAVRWRLDETDPQVKEALIARGVGAAEHVFGRKPLPAGPPIDAGHATAEEEVLEGEARPAEDEPPVKEPPAKPPEPPGVTRERAAEIIGHVEQLRRSLRWKDETRKQPATDEQAGYAAHWIAKAIAGDKRLSENQTKRIRRAVLTHCFGPFTKYVELNNEQLNAFINYAVTKPAEIRELVAFIVANDPQLADVRDILAAQGSWLEAARVVS